MIDSVWKAGKALSLSCVNICFGIYLNPRVFCKFFNADFFPMYFNVLVLGRISAKVSDFVSQVLARRAH